MYTNAYFCICDDPLQRGLCATLIYIRTLSGIDLVSIHIRGNNSRTICLLRVMITTRLFLNTVNRSPSESQSLRIVYTMFIMIFTVTPLFMAVCAQ
jgi:hypothetical protein